MCQIDFSCSVLPGLEVLSTPISFLIFLRAVKLSKKEEENTGGGESISELDPLIHKVI